MIYKIASYASWPDDRRHTTAKLEGEGGRQRGQLKLLLLCCYSQPTSGSLLPTLGPEILISCRKCKNHAYKLHLEEN